MYLRHRFGTCPILLPGKCALHISSKEASHTTLALCKTGAWVSLMQQAFEPCSMYRALFRQHLNLRWAATLNCLLETRWAHYHYQYISHSPRAGWLSYRTPYNLKPAMFPEHSQCRWDTIGSECLASDFQILHPTFHRTGRLNGAGNLQSIWNHRSTVGASSIPGALPEGLPSLISNEDCHQHRLLSCLSAFGIWLNGSLEKVLEAINNVYFMWFAKS